MPDIPEMVSSAEQASNTVNASLVSISSLNNFRGTKLITVIAGRCEKKQKYFFSEELSVP